MLNNNVLAMFSLTYLLDGQSTKVALTLNDNGTIGASIQANKIGTYVFYATFHGQSVVCQKCSMPIFAGDIDDSKT